MTNRKDQSPPGFTATGWTIVKVFALCAAGFATVSVFTGLAVVLWLSTAAP